MNTEDEIKDKIEELITEIPVIGEVVEQLLTEVPDAPAGELLTEVPEAPVKRGRGRPKKDPLAEANAKISEKITPGEMLTPKHIKLIRGNFSKRTLKARFGI